MEFSHKQVIAKLRETLRITNRGSLYGIINSAISEIKGLRLSVSRLNDQMLAGCIVRKRLVDRNEVLEDEAAMWRHEFIHNMQTTDRRTGRTRQTVMAATISSRQNMRTAIIAVDHIHEKHINSAILNMASHSPIGSGPIRVITLDEIKSGGRLLGMFDMVLTDHYAEQVIIQRHMEKARSK